MLDVVDGRDTII